MTQEKTIAEIIAELKSQHVDLLASLGDYNDEYRARKKEVDDVYMPEIRKRNDALAELRNKIIDLEKVEKSKLEINK